MSQSFTGDYFLSIPERFIRSAAAITGGASLFLTRSLLPDLVRESTTYQVTIGDMQRFLISRIAQVDSQFSPGIKPVSDDYIYHKMAGNVLELASFMAVRFSPVWAFAIVSDVAGGSSSYFERLVQKLKEMEILDQDADLYNIQDILESIQKASSTSARAIDRPPLSQAELGKIVDELRSDYSRLGKSGLNLMPQVEKIQDQMETVSKQEGISPEELSDVMALQASSLAKTGLNTAVAVGKTTGELIDEQIFASYTRTLDEINKVGLPKYTVDNLEPFINSAIDHLDPGKTTWTERKLAEIMGSDIEPELLE
jgi:hypothetical protein